jgi:hypothetical protein
MAFLYQIEMWYLPIIINGQLPIKIWFFYFSWKFGASGKSGLYISSWQQLL